MSDDNRSMTNEQADAHMRAQRRPAVEVCPYVVTDAEGTSHCVLAESDAGVLDLIARILRSPEWSVSYLEDIADIVRQSGRPVGEPLEGEEPWPRH